MPVVSAGCLMLLQRKGYLKECLYHLPVVVAAVVVMVVVVLVLVAMKGEEETVDFPSFHGGLIQ